MRLILFYCRSIKNITLISSRKSICYISLISERGTSYQNWDEFQPTKTDLRIQEPANGPSKRNPVSATCSRRVLALISASLSSNPYWLRQQRSKVHIASTESTTSLDHHNDLPPVFVYASLRTEKKQPRKSVHSTSQCWWRFSRIHSSCCGPNRLTFRVDKYNIIVAI